MRGNLFYLFIALFASVYSLLAFIPFTFQQVITLNLIPEIGWLANAFPLLFAVAAGLVACESKSRFRFRILAVQLGLAFFFLAIPVLTHLRNDTSSLVGAFLWLSIPGIFLFTESRTRPADPSPAGPALVNSVPLTAPLNYGLTAVLAALFSLAVETLLAGKLSAAMGITQFLLTFLFAAVLSLFGLPSLFVLGTVLLQRWGLQALGIPGLVGWIYAAGVTGLITGFASVYRWKIDAGRGLLAFTLSGACAYVAILRAPYFDWNFIFQRMFLTASWIFAWYGVRGAITNRKIIPERPWVNAAILVAASVAFALLGNPEPRSVPERVAVDFIVPRRAEGSNLFSFLQLHSNLGAGIKLTLPELQTPVPRPEPGKPRPNIFFIVVDSLRRDYLSPYNSKVGFTPAIGKFALESKVFTNGFTRYGATGLSEPSLWAGSLVPHQQYPAPYTPLNSLEKLVRAEGYESFVSRDSILDAILSPDFPSRLLDAGKSTQSLDLCGTLSEMAEASVKRDAGGRPIFMYTQSQNIHISVLAKKPSGSSPGSEYPGFYPPYAGSLERLDRCFGAFIEKLKELKIYDESIVILTADHGDSLGEDGRFGHAYTLFPEVVRVPLLIHLPRAITREVATDRLAFTTDITPTLYDLLSQPLVADDGITGRSLLNDSPRPEKEQLLSSSYGAVFGLLTGEGKNLHITDAINFKSYDYDLSGDSPAPVTLSSDLRAQYETTIREKIIATHKRYGYEPNETL